MPSQCPSCSIKFSAPDHLPIIFPSCLHHLCSSCISSSSEPSPGKIQCCVPECQAVVHADDPHLAVVDRHLLGCLEMKQTGTLNEAQGAMSDHLAQLIIPSSQSSNISLENFTERICKDHGKEIEFVALEDLRLGCSFCAVLGELSGRRLVSYHDVVDELRTSGLLKTLVVKSGHSLEKMLSAKSSVISSIQSVSSWYMENVQRLDTHMDKCHRVLEVLKGKVTNQLKQRKEERMVRLRKVWNDLDRSMTNLEQLLEVAEWQIENADEPKYDMLELMGEMDKLNKEDVARVIIKEERFDVDIDLSIFSSITNHISLCEIKTESVEEKSRGRSESLTELLGSLLEKNDFLRKPTIVGHENLVGTEDVVLLHVESPESFFMMRTRDWQLAETLRMQLRMKWETGERGKVEVDDIAVVKVENANVYHRVKIVTVDSDLAWISYLDQGSYSQVPLTSLVRLLEKLSSWPSLAHHCSLAGVSSESEWGREAARGVKEFCGDAACKADIRGRGEDKATIVAITKVEDKAYVSLSDFLVFRGLASLEREDESCPPSSTRSFLSLPLDRKATDHLVKVVHVDSPGRLFVNLVGENLSYLTYMDSLMKEMQEEFMQDNEQQTVLLPFVGLVCIAKLYENDQYYRVQVLEVVSKEGLEVKVVFVDLGMKHVVHSSGLRRIPDKFLKLPAMAIGVGLAGIKPVGEEWSEEALKYVRDTVKDKVMRMKIHERKKGNNLVMMIENDNPEHTSVNMKIVQDGYAIAVLEDVVNDEKEPSPVKNLSQFKSVGLEPGTQMTCRVVRVSSPDNISLRRLDEEEQFYKLSSEMTIYLESNHSATIGRYWQEGDSCAVRTSCEGWVRARVDRIMEKGMVELLLYDYRSKVVVQIDSLIPLPDQFSTASPYCWTVQIPGLMPTGGAKSWTDTACERIKDILVGANMEVDLEMRRRVNEGFWQADVFVKEIEDDSGPLDPEQFKYKSVGSELVELGLAIPAGDVDAANKSVGGSSSDMINFRKNLTNELSSDDNEAEVEVNEDTPGSCWQSAKYPRSSEFAGSVSHVDWDCQLYLSSMEEHQDNLRIIGSVLDSKYADSSPSPHDLQWSVGEACIAKFCLDKKWYRGVVLEVRDMAQCLVKFVDYGSEELCKPENMRKGLFMTDIPVQCFTVQMDIDPITSKWEEGVLNFIHKTVIDRLMQVTIIGDQKVFPLMVKMVTQAGLDVGELLVNNGYARGGKNVGMFAM